MPYYASEINAKKVISAGELPNSCKLLICPPNQVSPENLTYKVNADMAEKVIHLSHYCLSRVKLKQFGIVKLRV